MAIPEQMVIALVSLLFFPALCLLFLVIALASLGKSLGIRKKYVAFLLKVFEFGRTRIESYNRQQAEQEESDDEEDLIEGELDDKVFKQPINNHNGTGDNQPLILRDIALSATKGIKLGGPFLPYHLNLESVKREFHISDSMYFAKCGVETIIEDEVTRCFSTAELPSWNFLTRTNQGYQYISIRLTILWWLGFIFRYFVLFPFRLFLAVIGIGWLIICTAFIGYLPNGSFKRKMNSYVTLMCYRILSRACSLIITYHNPENKGKNGICVANHTSPIDVIVLSCDSCYALVGQAHSGFLGVMQRAMGRATSHIWFERSEIKDREAVAKRLKEHVDDHNKLPILIFPEGTCINNTSVMMFKKGSFEVGGKIYPVAIKYDPLFGDAFWNSSKQSMIRHLFDVMTSWALVCDVWYLPPEERKPGEDAVDFANRVKSLIASKGGLVDLEWDGQLKRMRAKESWKEKTKEDYSKLIKVD